MFPNLEKSKLFYCISHFVIITFKFHNGINVDSYKISRTDKPIFMQEVILRLK